MQLKRSTKLGFLFVTVLALAIVACGGEPLVAEMPSTDETSSGDPPATEMPSIAEDLIERALPSVEIHSARDLVTSFYDLDQCRTLTDTRKSFILMADIDLSSHQGAWQREGRFEGCDRELEIQLEGVFDGNGYTISNLNSHHGLFASIGRQGVVKNLKLENITNENKRRSRTIITSSDGAGLARENYGSIINVTISYTTPSRNGDFGGLVVTNNGTISHSSADIESRDLGDPVGGLVVHNYGVITDSETRGRIIGDSDGSGGLVATNNEAGVIRNSNSKVRLSGSGDPASKIGGLVGLNHGKILTSHAIGAVAGNDDVGGLVGINGGLIFASNALGNVSSGNRGDYVGSLVGSNSGAIINAFAIGVVSGGRVERGTVGGLVGGSGGGGSGPFTEDIVDSYQNSQPDEDHYSPFMLNAVTGEVSFAHSSNPFSGFNFGPPIFGPAVNPARSCISDFVADNFSRSSEERCEKSKATQELIPYQGPNAEVFGKLANIAVEQFNNWVDVMQDEININADLCKSNFVLGFVMGDASIQNSKFLETTCGNTGVVVGVTVGIIPGVGISVDARDFLGAGLNCLVAPFNKKIQCQYDTLGFSFVGIVTDVVSIVPGGQALVPVGIAVGTARLGRAISRLIRFADDEVVARFVTTCKKTPLCRKAEDDLIWNAIEDTTHRMKLARVSPPDEAYDGLKASQLDAAHLCPRSLFITICRDLIVKYDIDMNGPDNLVWLVNRKARSKPPEFPDMAVHQTDSKAFHEYVLNLRESSDLTTEQGARRFLGQIKDDLLHGRVTPKEGYVH